MPYAYHRLFRARPRYRWWKPLVALVVGVGIYYALSIVWQEILLLTVDAIGGTQARLDLVADIRRNQQDASNPLVMLFTLGSLALLLPSMIVGVRILGLGPIGQLSSVVARLRWRWLARCIVPAVVYMALQVGLGFVVPASWQGQGSDTAATQTTTPPLALFVSIVLILLLVPFQAAGEEFAFRGFGMQALGSWVRWPVVAIVVPTVAFAFAHSYNVWGKLDVATLGVAFAYLTWRTGGLEAGIVAHVVNNVVVFLLAAPVVSTQQADGSPGAFAVTLVASAAYVGLVTLVARRNGPERVAPESVSVGDAAV